MATPQGKIEPLPKDEPEDYGNCAQCGVKVETPIKCPHCREVSKTYCSDACLDIHTGRIFPRKKPKGATA